MKVGDYVRTEDGRIGQYIKPELGTPYITNRIEYYEINKGKYSPNIIDLIEVGDYVNGYQVISIGIDDKKKNVELYVANQGYDELVLEQDIKSIVTKEQFESMKYKIGE